MYYPASSDSIVSSNGQEDHVSMGANAAIKLFKIMDNLEHILAIELMNATQGIDFRRPPEALHTLKIPLGLSQGSTFIREDIVMYKDNHQYGICRMYFKEKPQDFCLPVPCLYP